MEIGLLELIITSIVTALSAGGAVVWYKEYGEQQNDQHEQSLDVAAIFKDRMRRVEDRLQRQEKRLRKLEQRESRLVAEVRVLITRIDTLLRRLAEHEEISDEERQEYLELAIDLYAADGTTQDSST